MPIIAASQRKRSSHWHAIVKFSAVIVVGIVLFNLKLNDSIIIIANISRAQNNSTAKSATIAAGRCPAQSVAASLHGLIPNGNDDNKLDREKNNNRPKHHAASSALDNVCSLMPRGATASSIWRRQFNEILKSSIHPLDLHQAHKPWTKRLLELLPPHLLQRGMRSSPNRVAWLGLLKRISNIIQQRNANHTNHPINNTINNTITIPPLQVVVFGGSVTSGTECFRLPTQVRQLISRQHARDMRFTIVDYNCAWPLRLQWLLDSALGPNVVQIHNYASGGTDSDCALPKLRYSLYLEEHETLYQNGPDVIINAYSANDNYFFDYETCHSTLDSKCFWNGSQNLTQQFMTASLMTTCHHSSTRQRRQPLVLYMDDYIGGAWNTIPAELQHHESVQEQLEYDGMAGHVTSIPVLSQLVWAYPQINNNSNSLTSPPLLPFLLSPPFPNVHFSMPGHVARAWIFAFALLQFTVDACQDEVQQSQRSHPRHGQDPGVVDQEHGPLADTSWIANNSSLFHMIRNRWMALPRLRSELRLNQVPLEWNHQVQQYQTLQSAICANVVAYLKNSTTGDVAQHRSAPCSLAFVAGPGGTHYDPNHFREFLLPYLKNRYAWKVELDFRDGFVTRLGLSANKPNANVIVQVAKLVGPVQVITVQYLKSYGDKWMNSMVLFQLYIQRPYANNRTENNGTVLSITSPEFITSWELSGYHNRNISVSYTHRVDIGPERAAKVGDVVDLHMQLINGSSFKLRSLMMCFR